MTELHASRDNKEAVLMPRLGSRFYLFESSSRFPEVDIEIEKWPEEIYAQLTIGSAVLRRYS